MQYNEKFPLENLSTVKVIGIIAIMGSFILLSILFIDYVLL